MSTILGTNGSDTKAGTDLADTLYGFDGDDELSGKKGNDLFIGGTGNDRLHGNDGDDTFFGGPFDGLYGQGTDGQGDDTFYGDGGFDTVSYANTGRVIVHLGNGTATNSSIGHDTLVGIDHVIGSWDIAYGDLLIGREDDWLGYQGDDKLEGLAGPDTLYGRGGDDYLLGGTENDVLSGEGDDDRLAGGGGDDWLDGGEGDDYLSGSTGVDAASYVNATDGIHVYLGSTTDGSPNVSDDGYGGSDRLSSIENVYGSHHDDDITGSAAANQLNGRDGEDFLGGGGGNDTLDGGTGYDTLWGDQGADNLWGGADRDVSAYWYDFDRFLFNAGDTGVGAGNRDIIHDFQHGADAIVLDFMDGAQDVPGNQAFSFVGTAAFTAEAQVRQTYESGNTVIQGNTDQDTAPEFEIQLRGLHTMTSSDFVDNYEPGDWHF
jgi:Ca2+-binding RTX toxin-like protein